MFEAIIKLLPEWLMPAVFGLLVWFASNYFLIAPEIGRRTVENVCAEERRVFCHCVAGHMISNARLELAMWTASLGFYQVDKSSSVINARQEGIAQCNKA